MSQKYTGGFITKSPVAPTTTAASGIWTLDQQQQAQKAGTWPSPPIFIEDLFSTYLYTDTGSTQTIVNGINLASKGGMVWAKCRSAVDDHIEWDSARGTSYYLNPNTTGAQAAYAATFNSNGVSIPSLSSGQTYTSWTFAKQPKFFDVVTYSGNGTARTIAHNLGSVPGCIIVKRTDSAGFDWAVYHTSTGNTQRLLLNTTDPAGTSSSFWNNTTPTSTVFTVGSNVNVNASGGSYVAYLFANDAGGFPVSGGGSTNGISCGSFTIDGSGKFTVNLGYEPQWIMIKLTNDVSNWSIFDNMRGMPVGSPTTRLLPNLSDAESSAFSFVDINATGFAAGTGSGNPYSAGQTWIYVAIRRGPMKPPTTGTSVFYPNTITGNATDTTITSTGFAPDLFFSKARSFDSLYFNVMVDRLRGASQFLVPTNTIAETLGTNVVLSLNMNGVTIGTSSNANASGVTYVQWNFKRAPGFFDEVCYTGTYPTANTVTHNLGVTPELIITKARTSVLDWPAFCSAIASAKSKYFYFNTSDAVATNTDIWNNTDPTSTTFQVNGTRSNTNTGGTGNMVAYLFATCPGVSKVGTYTGTGALQTVNCGFTTGARFVLIRRSDNTGDWYVWDSARGITSGNDPYLLTNTTATEVTGTNYVDTTAVGFQVTAAAPADINANGGTFIFLAIA